MGWSFPWVSSAGSDFSADYGASAPAEEVEQWVAAGLPPAVEQTARASGTDLAGYLTERPGLSTFAFDGGDVYHTDSSPNRGLEVMLAYYPLLDRVPNGRDEPDNMPFWIRHHDEY
jgi:predicted dithiol-disulfide oxidoreductase (DUF899 family)